MNRDDDNPNNDFEFEEPTEGEGIDIPDDPDALDEENADLIGDGLDDNFSDEELDAVLQDSSDDDELSDADPDASDLDEMGAESPENEEMGAYGHDEQTPMGPSSMQQQGLSTAVKAGIGAGGVLVFGVVALVLMPLFTGGGEQPDPQQMEQAQQQQAQQQQSSDGSAQAGGDDSGGIAGFPDAGGGDTQQQAQPAAVEDQEQQREREQQSRSQVAQQHDMEITTDDVEEAIEGAEPLQAVRDAMTSQGGRIDSLEAAVERSRQEITDDVASLEHRVGDIEEMIASGELVEAAREESEADTSGPEFDQTVHEAQVRLRAYGYQPGPIDGLWGPRTRSAIERFQNQHGMDTDGELSEAVSDKLQSNDVAMYEGSHDTTRVSSSSHGTEESEKAASQEQSKPEPEGWYVRGVTSDRAIIYSHRGKRYTVSAGSEVPGYGQVEYIDADSSTVALESGHTIERRTN